MSSLDKPPMDDAEPTPEQRLRKLLTEAVEPVQPGPGAQARLQAKIRKRAAPRDLRRGLRWAGATLGVTALVAGAAVAISTQHGHDTNSSASSASSADKGAAARASSPVAGPSTADSQKSLNPNLSASASAGAGSAPAAQPSGLLLSPAVPDKATAGGTTARTPAESGPLDASFTPGDLNGDHRADVLTLSGRQLTAKFATGTQLVTLPQVSSGARVLGVTQLKTTSGAFIAVAFVRLGGGPGQARDTLVAVVAGKLTVLRLAGKPVVLSVTGAQGYTCGGPLVVTANGVVSYVVSGADLVADGSTGSVAKAGSNCGFS